MDVLMLIMYLDSIVSHLEMNPFWRSSVHARLSNSTWLCWQIWIFLRISYRNEISRTMYYRLLI